MRRIKRFITYVKRFFYYGYIGANDTYDFDAVGAHTLIHAHLKRVETFMHTPELTHLLWSEDPQNRSMRQLRELTELSARISGKYGIGYYMNEAFKKYPRRSIDVLSSWNDLEYRKDLGIAFKKDDAIKKGLEDRYWYLLRYKMPGFWD